MEYTKDGLDAQWKKIHEHYRGMYNPETFWESMGETYIKSFFHEEDKLNSLTLHVNALLTRIDAFKPNSVLEVGCGFGRLLAYIVWNNLAQRVEGIELAQSMIDSSVDYFKRCQFLPYVPKITKAKAQELPFKDNEFDFVYTHVCLTHIPPDEAYRARQEISRVAKDTIIHFERYRFPDEHPSPHRWTHDNASHYVKMGWKIQEYGMVNEQHHTTCLILRK